MSTDPLDPPARPGLVRPGRYAARLRRCESWPCPKPSEFSLLVAYELHDISLQLSGELTSANADAFLRCVAMALGDRPRRLVLELSAMDSIDPTGLEGFVETFKGAASSGAELVLDSPREDVRRLIADVLPDVAYRLR